MKSPRMAWRAGAIAVALAVLGWASLWAQQTAASSIRGVVKDPSGAPVAGASVTVTDVARGIARKVTVSDSGNYSVQDLLPGTFTVRAAATGFMSWERTNILLQSGEELEINPVLMAGADRVVTITGGPLLPNLRVLCSNGVKSAIEELQPEIERAIVRRVAIQFDSSQGLMAKIDAGEPFDVAVLSYDNIDALAIRGLVAARPRAILGRTGVGIGVRAGTRKPDISTPEGLKRTLLNAKSIALNPTGASINYFNRTVERLGIGDAVKPKLMLDPEPGRPQKNVAEGKADLVWTQIPEIRFFPGIELAGNLPTEFQGYTDFAAGVAVKPTNELVGGRSAATMVNFLSSPAAVAILRAKGVEAR